MFNFQNLNGLFNLAPETLSQINQAASVASVPKPAPTPSFALPPNFNFGGIAPPTSTQAAPTPPARPAPTPSFTLPPNFNFGGMMQPAMTTAASSDIANPVVVETDNSFAIPNVSLSNTDTGFTTVKDPVITDSPAPVVTPPTLPSGMLTSSSVSGTQGLPVENEETFETVVETPSENQQYYVIPSNEKEVDKRGYMQYSVESGVKTMGEAELKKYYESEDNELLRQTFSDFNKYRDYMAEKSALYDSGVLDKWWEVTEEQEQEFADTMFDAPDSVTTAEEFGEFLNSQGIFGVTQDPSGGYITDAVTNLMSPEEKAAYEAQQIQDYKETGTYQNSRYMQYSAQADQEVLQVLNEKHGAPSRMGETITDSDGSKYQWTGDGFTKIADPPEESLLGTLVEVAVKGGITAALTAGIAPVLAGAGGLSAGAAKGAAAGLASAGVQGATTGKIDPKSVIASTITAGLGAGDVVNEALGGINPESFVGGAVDSVVNNAITQGIVTGSLDTDELLQAGLTGGAINSIKDFIKSANQTGLDKQVELYMLQGNSREDAVKLALQSGIVDTSSLGGLVGPTGLLAPLGLDEYVDTSWLGKTTDFLGLTSPSGDMFQDKDGNLFTENEVIAQGYDPSEIYFGTDTSSGLQPVNVTPELTTIGKIANAPVAAFEKVFGGALDAASRSAFINKYGFDPADPANIDATKAVFATDGFLNERYTFTPDNFERTPDSTLYGVLEGIENAYTTGPSFETEILPNPDPTSTGVGATYIDTKGQFTPTTVDEVSNNLTGGEKLYASEVTLPTYEDDILDSTLKGALEGAQAANKEDATITDEVNLTEEVDIAKDDTTIDLIADTTKEDLDVIEEGVEEELDVIEEDIKETIKEELNVTEEDIKKEFDKVEEDIKEELNIIEKDTKEEDLGVTEEEDLGVIEEEEELPVTEEESSGGGGGGSIGGGGVGGGSGDFTPFMSGISYQTPQIVDIIQSPNVDYNAQLNALINRNVGLFEGMV